MGATLLMGVIVGMSAGVVLAFLSHLAPALGAGNFIPDTDQPKLFGKKVTRREAHLVGLLVHIILSAVFGFVFALCVELEVFSRFSIGAMLWFVLGMTLFSGLIVMPIEGHGVFGRKHDAWFALDALITNLIWGALFLLLLHVWLLV